MNFSKNFLLLLASLIFCFVIVNCSEIPPSADVNNEMIVNNARGEGHNGPFLPDNLFGSYKLIRPLPKNYLKLYMKYDLIMLSVPFSYALSSIFNYDPRTNHCILFGLGSYFALFHLPSLFGLQWTASISQQRRPGIRSVIARGIYIWDIVSYVISRIFNEPRVYHYTAIGAASYFSIIHWPLLFGLDFLASRTNSDGQILSAHDFVDEIFLAEGTLPYDRDLCFQTFREILPKLTERLLESFGLRRFD